MKVEIVCVGTELLLGDIVNTNAPYLAKECADLGLDCYYQTVIGDNHDRLLRQAKESIERSDMVIFTGGLGPTYDDITKETVAEALEETLIFDQKAYDLIEEYFKHRGRTTASSNRKQAFTFANSHTIYNDVGTAPAHVVMRNGKIVVLLPGPPREMMYNFEHKVKPILRNAVKETIVSKSLYLINIGESELEVLIYDMMKSMVNPTIAPYAMDDGVKLRVTAKAATKEEAYAMIEPVVVDLMNQLQPYVYAIDEPNIAIVLAHKLNQKGYTLGVVDNVTDGSIVTRLKDGQCSMSASLINQYTVKTLSHEENLCLAHKIKKEYTVHHACDVLVSLTLCALESNNVSVSLWIEGQLYTEFLSVRIREKQSDETFRQRVGSQAIKIILDHLGI